MPALRDRVVELRKVTAAELRANPSNWRTHPKAQRAALRGLFEEIGFADPVLARVARAGDGIVKSGAAKVGDLVILDGHLRDEEAPPTFKLPVVVLDLTEAEGQLFLAAADPLSALAGQDDEQLMKLLDDIDTGSAAVQKMLADLVKEPGEGKEPDIEEKFQVLVECETEEQQVELLERLQSEGLKVRSLVG